MSILNSLSSLKTTSKNTNKLFTQLMPVDNQTYSKIRHNREYLMSKQIAEDFNTYTSFTPFDVIIDNFDANATDDKEVGTYGVRSLFNKTGAVILGDNSSSRLTHSDTASEWRISNNVPLLDNQTNRKNIKKYSGCSVKELVEASQKGELGRETYDYSDFMYCKHLGKMSNNYMITLRRFPIPVDDYISTLGTVSRTQKDIASQNSQCVGCMVTWMGTPGNDMSSILKYSFNLPFKSADADWEENSEDADSGGGMLNSIAAMFDSTYRQQYQQGYGGGAANAIMGKFFPNTANGRYNVRDLKAFQDKNKVYGPIDAIKSTYMRDKTGLKFEQNLTLTFDYELRSYNGINGRQAFLDLISNILMVTYSTGTFWGGGYKSVGMHQNNLFTNMETFKVSGGVTDYINAFSNDVQKLGKSTQQKAPKSAKEMGKAVLNAFNQLGGMILAGHLNKLGRPHKVMLNSLLSPAPVGFWHVTIGNPHHPIMSMGNMILKNTTIEHYGPLGLDDFPTGIKVTCELTHGKPRDIRDIEKLYMHGNDRIYHGMGSKVFDMYNNSKEYSNKNGELDNIIAKGDPDKEIVIGTGKGKQTIATINDVSKMGKVLQKYFGHTDTFSIYVAAAEQEYGASKPSQKDYNNKQHGGKQT